MLPTGGKTVVGDVDVPAAVAINGELPLGEAAGALKMFELPAMADAGDGEVVDPANPDVGE